MNPKKLLSFVSAAVIALCSFSYDTKKAYSIGKEVNFDKFDTRINDGEVIRGVDISSIISIEKAGVEFYNEYGNKQDIFRTLAENDVNYIRVRVWNSPYDNDGNYYGGGNNDLYTAAEIGKRAAEYDIKLLVDIQYSDFWADPGKQTRPKYWQPHDHNTLKSEIYKYTTWVLETIREAGGDIGMVQVGNETNCFFCGEKDMYKICDLFASGNKAVRDFDKSILIAHHFANPAHTDYYEWYAKVMDECRLDYDVFATSYYPYWHGTTENLTAVLKSIGEKYNKYVMVAETAYPYTDEDGDNFGNAVTSQSSEVDLKYPISVEGQAQCLSDIFQAVADVGSKGIGVFYWEPAWLGVPDISWEEQHKLWNEYGSGWATDYAGEYDKEAKEAGGSSYDNQALFGFDGKPLASLKVFNNIYPKNDTEKNFYKDDIILSGEYRIKNADSGMYLTVANGNAKAGANVVQYTADGAADYNTWNMKSCGNGYYELYSGLGDGETYLLDLDYGKQDNKTNIGIYTKNDNDTQKFRLIRNDDGTYYIATKSTRNSSVIEIAGADRHDGGNAQQFEINGHYCQKWILEPVEKYYMTCDINESGDIDIFDYIMMKNMLINGNTDLRCDADDDKEVTVNDILKMKKHIIGEENLTPKQFGTPKNTIIPEMKDFPQ